MFKNERNHYEIIKVFSYETCAQTSLDQINKILNPTYGSKFRAPLILLFKQNIYI